MPWKMLNLYICKSVVFGWSSEDLVMYFLIEGKIIRSEDHQYRYSPGHPACTIRTGDPIVQFPFCGVVLKAHFFFRQPLWGDRFKSNELVIFTFIYIAFFALVLMTSYSKKL